MLPLKTWDRMGRQEDGLTATTLTRSFRECGMEVWRAARWRQSVAARRAQSPGRIAISLVDSFSLVTFAGLAAKTPAPASFTIKCGARMTAARDSRGPFTVSLDLCVAACLFERPFLALERGCLWENLSVSKYFSQATNFSVTGLNLSAAWKRHSPTAFRAARPNGRASPRQRARIPTSPPSGPDTGPLPTARYEWPGELFPECASCFGKDTFL